VQRHPHPPRLAELATALVTVLLLVAGCGGGSTTTTGPGATATPSRTTVKVFFARHPDSDTNPSAVYALTRSTGATTVQDQATFALEEMLKGPTSDERAQGYYSPFDGQLALQSVCSGPFRDFDLSLDHRGTKAEPGTATLQFCRRVDIPGDLDGPRMAAMVAATLMQFSDISSVAILDYQGSCFDDLSGQNACLSGTQPAGYPVKVYLSRHPETDADFTAVFPVTRISPNLGVATFAVEQLLAGPTPTEQPAGYFTDLTRVFNRSDPSSCGGADFTIALDKRGTRQEVGTATLQFRRTIASGGIGDDARILAELRATLMQFENIQRVVILNKAGNCFGDMTTQNRCLTPSQPGYPVVVYFSKHPDSDIAPAKVFAVDRVAPDLMVATYAIGQLLAGPSAAEKAQGLYTPLEGALSGASTCNGADFTIRLNWNRSQTEAGTATLQFCRDLAAGHGFGDTGALIVRNEITRTLTQFPNIQKVVILTKDGACFDDLVGCA
jgi:hypothetical protein